MDHPGSPRSALGLIAAAIDRRRQDGVAPFTLQCCDNLPSNGRAVHRLLCQFAGLRDPDLAAFIEGEVACPDTMVDRIVPATVDADRARIATALGLQDAWPVITEPFTQWVVEDRFPLGRPEWERAGVTMVGDVGPFEAMKLRMLNASHSALAYLGYLAGAETVADAMRMPSLAAFAERVMEEAATTLPPRARYGGLLALPARPLPATRPYAIGPGKSPWTAHRSCHSAFSQHSRTGYEPDCRSTLKP